MTVILESRFYWYRSTVVFGEHDPADRYLPRLPRAARIMAITDDVKKAITFRPDASFGDSIHDGSREIFYKNVMPIAFFSASRNFSLSSTFCRGLRKSSRNSSFFADSIDILRRISTNSCTGHNG